MKYGFVKVAAATPKVTVADCTANTTELIRITKLAHRDGVKVIVFPELSVTSYSCSDLFLTKPLCDAAVTSLKKYLEDTAKLDILSVVGLPMVWHDKLYNCAAVCLSGKLLGIVPKTNIPNYAEFYEARYFSPAPSSNETLDFFGEKIPFGNRLVFCCSNYPALKVGIEICEDLWVQSPQSVTLSEAGAMIIGNLSASNETIGKDDYRRLLVKSQSARTVTGYIYADAGEGESTTDLVFSGHSIISENGSILAERKPFDFSKSYISSEIDLDRLAHDRRKTTTYSSKNSSEATEIPFEIEISATNITRYIDAHPFVPDDISERERRCESILQMQSYALKQRIEKAYAKKCVIGISGGLDSCLALLATIRAIDLLGRPHTDVIGVTMPCFGTTERTKGNAELLCEKLGVDLKCIDIAEAVNIHFRDIGHSSDNLNVVYENAQARERTQIIMDIANAENGIVVGTGDLSELALGWATYNGDHMSMYGVNASIPKTLVKYIVSYCADVCESEKNSELAAVLRDILATPVSPELLPANDNGDIAQKTEDIVGPYELHDFYLYNMVRYGFSPEKLFVLAKKAFENKYSNEILVKWLEKFVRRFFAQQFKRSCLPDGPKVGTVALSPRGDWRMSSDSSASVWVESIERLKKLLN